MEVRDIYLMEKVWLGADGSYAKSECFAYDSFRAANRAMYDDFGGEFEVGSDCGNDAESQDSGVVADQLYPFECDMEAEIRFRDGRKIKWEIFRRNVERLSDSWTNGTCPNKK